MKKLGLSLILLLIFCNSVFADIQGSINNGLNWLMTNQNADGSYGNQSDLIFRDTEEVLNTFNILNQKGGQYQNGVQWAVNTKVNNIDFIARKILLLSKEGIDTSTGINLLLPNQNADGGWGLAAQESDSIDTAFALQALRAVNYSDQTIINSAINYLLSTQNPDGGWGFYQDDESNVYMTTIVSMTLEQFSRTLSLASAINKATSYLLSHQNTDGGFGSSSSTVYETAYAYMALVEVTTDNTVLGNAVNYLKNTQLPNGSWLQDPYSTALVLRALYLSENKPAPPPPPTTGAITGRVVDSSTNQPLSGVSVILQSAPAINTVTDAAGSFTLSAVLQGSQQISFSLPGYASSTVTVTLTAGSITNLGTIPLSLIQTTGMVKGTVTDASNGLPLSGVAIGITGSFTGNTVTGTDGSFTFTNVTPGAVTITAAKSGYYSVTGAGTVAAGKILFFNPQLSTQPPAATTGNFTGKVFDILNNPIQGATISVSGGSSGGTDSQGVFLIQGLTPGTYQASVSAPGYISQTYQVMILAGATNDMQKIYLTPSPSVTTITGKVTDASTGAPVANADVAISGTTLSAKTDSAGVYTISGISLLEFSLKASATGYDSKSYNISTAAYGAYAVDFALSPSRASDIIITFLATDRTSYSANNNVKITATIENTGSMSQETIIIAEIRDNQGNTVALSRFSDSETVIAPLSSTTVNTTWNTGQYNPDDYQVVFKVTEPSATYYNFPGIVLAEKETSFTIHPFVGIANSAIKVKPTFAYVGATETMTLALSLTNQSNMPADLVAGYEFKSPSGAVLSSGVTAFSIPLAVISTNVSLATFTNTFNESGDYPINVVVYKDGAALSSISSIFPVLSNIRIEPSRSVTPATVLPDGSGKVRITIELKGVEVK